MKVPPTLPSNILALTRKWVSTAPTHVHVEVSSWKLRFLFHAMQRLAYLIKKNPTTLRVLILFTDVHAQPFIALQTDRGFSGNCFEVFYSYGWIYWDRKNLFDLFCFLAVNSRVSQHCNLWKMWNSFCECWKNLKIKLCYIFMASKLHILLQHSMKHLSPMLM